MGSAARAQAPASEQVYPWFLLHELPIGVTGLAMAGLFAAAQGSLDSAINAMASSAVADLYWPLRKAMGHSVDKQSSKTPRLAVGAKGGVQILFAVASIFLADRSSPTPVEIPLN